MKVNVQDRLHALQRGFMFKGFSPEIAMQKAYKVLDFGATKQNTVLSYMDVFLYLGILFLLCIPFILLVKKGKKKVDVSAAMH